jgi:hypothetical protein
MRTFRLTAPIALAAIALIALVLVAAAAVPPQDAAPPPDAADPMVEMMKLAQPGPEHEELAKYAGTWECDVTLAMAPGAEPLRQTATVAARPILGGRFLQVETSGDVMGQPFESLTVFGFDRRHGQWTMVGFDTLGTYWVSATGERGEDGVIRMHGRDDDPMGAQVFVNELRLQGDDAFSSSLHVTQLGPQTFDEPFKMVEVKYRRR